MSSRGRRLQSALRAEFKEPIGCDIDEAELKEINLKHIIITVGDIVSLTAREIGIVPLLSIYDGFTERREETRFARLVKEEGSEPVTVSNPAGTITAELDSAVRNALTGDRPTIIRVEGEEDLALLPCVINAPEGAVVVYGWPGRGMKAVHTDGRIRRRLGALMEKMEELL